jgi:hypothetical protein
MPAHTTGEGPAPVMLCYEVVGGDLNRALSACRSRTFTVS